MGKVTAHLLPTSLKKTVKHRTTRNKENEKHPCCCCLILFLVVFLFMVLSGLNDFTRWKSLVRIQYRPPRKYNGL